MSVLTQPLLGKQTFDLRPDARHVGYTHCVAFNTVGVVVFHARVYKLNDAGFVEQERH